MPGLQTSYQSIQLPLYDRDDTYVKSEGGDPETASGNDQMYVNLIPKRQVNAADKDSRFSLEKRQGIEFDLDVLDSSGLAGIMSARDFISITQLNDVFVGAFVRNNGGTKTVEIIQIRPVAGTTVNIGTISTVAGPPAVNVSDNTDVYLTEIKVGNVPGVAVVITDVNGGAGTSAAYYALSSSGVFGAATLTKISDADFPTNQATYIHIVGPLLSLNQIFYVMASDGRIFNSNDDAIGTWSALGFLEAESYPDRGVGLFRYKHHVLAFGENSVEFFNDAGNDPTLGSPLERTEQAFIKFGAIYGKAVINIDDVLYWISTSASGTIGLWRLEEYAPVEVGSLKINLAYSGSASPKNTVIMTQMVINGINNLVITAQSSGIACFGQGYPTNVTNEPSWGVGDGRSDFLCYNLRDGSWWYMANSFLSGKSCYAAASTGYGTSGATKDVYTSYFLCGEPNSSGTAFEDYDWSLFKFVPAPNAVFLDWDTNQATQTAYYPMVYQSNVIWFGTEKRKFLHKFKIITNKNSFSTDSNPNHIKAMVSKEGFSIEEDPVVQIRTKALPASTAKPPRLYWNNFGAFRKLQYAIVGKTKDPFSMDAIELDMSQGDF